MLLDKLNVRKSPVYEIINGKILKMLTPKTNRYITISFNATTRIQYFLLPRKCAEITMLFKPNKPAEIPSSYKPISLVPILSKILENIILEHLIKHVTEDQIIPPHQFGFRVKHNTTEQIHKLVHIIREAYERKKASTLFF